MMVIESIRIIMYYVCSDSDDDGDEGSEFHEFLMDDPSNENDIDIKFGIEEVSILMNNDQEANQDYYYLRYESYSQFLTRISKF